MAQTLYKKDAVEATISEPEKVINIESETVKSVTVNEAARKKTYTGFKWENNAWKYLDEGKMLKNTFLVKDGKLYYFDEGGNRTTGWFHDYDGQTYFFDESGISQEGWIQTEEGWRFLSNGICLSSPP